MSTIIVMDIATVSVFFIDLNEEMTRKLEDEYDGCCELFLTGENLDEKFGFNVSCVSFMLVEDELEMFLCNPGNGEMVRMHLFA